MGLLYEIQSRSRRQAVVVLTLSRARRCLGNLSIITLAYPHLLLPTSHLISNTRSQPTTGMTCARRPNGAAEMEPPKTINCCHHTALRSRDSFAFTTRFNERQATFSRCSSGGKSTAISICFFQSNMI